MMTAFKPLYNYYYNANTLRLSILTALTQKHSYCRVNKNNKIKIVLF